MRRPLIALTALALTATTAFALAHQTHYMGSIAGKDGSKVTGSAMMMAGKTAGTTDVSIDIKGETPSTTRPWHVHRGSCAKAGGVFGGGASYTPITTDASGNGKSTATLQVALPDTGSYYVNVHESRENMAKIVACGDLAKM